MTTKAHRNVALRRDTSMWNRCARGEPLVVESRHLAEVRGAVERFEGSPASCLGESLPQIGMLH
jgi:hypothetical protein